MTGAELRRRRAAAQRLHRPDDGVAPADIVRHLLAVQAQDLRAARLALRARGHGFSAADVDAALEDGSLVIAWLLRSTLHLVAAEDFRWLHSLTAGIGEAGGRRRLAQLEVAPDDAERAVALIAQAVGEAPRTRAELAARLAAEGIPTTGQATPHLLALAARRGACLLGPLRDGAPVFVPPPDIVADPAPGADALARLTRRYLAAHGPATAHDLGRWSGLSLGDARTGFAALAGETHADGELIGLAGRREPPARIAPRLLPAFDPYLLGWRDRSFAVAPEHARTVHPGGGIVRAVATVDGRAVGTWTAPRGRVALAPFGPLSARDGAALRPEAADIARFG